jgi:N6-adenosine-specific RNA methylase IME4
MTDLPAVDALAKTLEAAQSPTELMRVLDMASAVERHGRRLRKSMAAAGIREAATDAYRAEIAAVFAQLEVIVRAARILPDAGRPKSSSDVRIYVDDFGISYETAARWKRQGEAVSDLDRPALRDKWITNAADVDPGEWADVSIAAIIRAARGGTRPAAETTPDYPQAGRYRCIVIDPPWPMARLFRQLYPGTGAHLDYATMTVDDIAALDVPQLAADGCHIYLWTTHRFLPDAFDIFDQWDARYECLMTWRKNEGMTPFSWQYDTEHVLFGRIGTLKLQQLGMRLSFDAPKGEHSVKPDVFYDRVLRASPAPRLEMFARTTREGFDAWGAEANAN